MPQKGYEQHPSKDAQYYTVRVCLLPVSQFSPATGPF